MNFISKLFLILSKKITRQKIYPFIEKNITTLNKKRIKILNIGSGGEIEKIIKSFNNVDVISIDIDKSRKPDIVIDISSHKIIKKIKFKPDLITCFEVLEHIKNPSIAINNLHKISNNKTQLIFSVPFIFPIHDEPNDYYRYTKFGLRLLFKKYSKVEIINRDGWLDNIFVLFVRLKFSRNYILKIVALLFAISYLFLFPIIKLIQKIVHFENITSGYLIKAKK